MSVCKRIFSCFLAFCLILPLLAAVPTTGNAASITPVSPQTALPNAITVATVYKAVTGINPANGHDLIYLMFKGGTVIVYDIDDKKVYDTLTGTPSTPFSGCFDDDGNFWFCGSGAALYKYTPGTKTMKKYGFDKTLFMGVGNLFAVTYYKGMLYFGTCNYGHLGMMDPKTGKVTQLSDWLNPYPEQAPDAYYCGWGGMHIENDYIYVTLDGDRNGDQVTSHQIIKFDLRTRKIVDCIDLSDTFKSAASGISYLHYADGLLFPTLSSLVDKPVAVDITGDKMKLVNIEGMGRGYINRTSSELNGKYYTVGYSGNKRTLFAYDPATKKASSVMSVNTSLGAINGVVTVSGDSRLPGESLVTYGHSNGSVHLYFFNPQTQQTVTYTDILAGQGSGNNLRAITVDPTGRYVYVGAYGYNKITHYDIYTGEAVTQDGYGHQTDALMFYDGFLWVGNYNTGTLTRFDTETGEAFPIFSLMSSVFQQKRMFGLAAGDGIVFSTTVPDTGMYGGTLNWFDTTSGKVYVAAGPNPDDVYYTLGSGWYNAATNQYESFDYDGDYRFDTYIPVNGYLEQRFYGLIENRCINSIVYYDGYIYGTTTKANGMGEGVDSVSGNAQIFVYDLRNLKLVGLTDLTKEIPGLATPVPYVNVVAQDPLVPGKFWGMVANTLFSFTFDTQTNEFSVKEELSLSKTDYKSGLSAWHPSYILFDGDYLYVTFGEQGVYMVRRSNPSENYKLSSFSVDMAAMAADGNLYFVDNVSTHISVLKVADQTQPLVAASAQAIIDALPAAGSVTAAHKDAIRCARAMYDALATPAKSKVNAQKLTAAEAVLDSLVPEEPDVNPLPPNDPLPPTQPTQPTQPTDPADPTTPADPTNPGQSTDPTTATQPSGSGDVGNAGGANDPNSMEAGKKSWLLPVICVGSVTLLGGGAAAVVIYKKKKKH